MSCASGAYKRSIEPLYGMAYTIKMSKKGDHFMEGYFDFVVPPLEGFWWQEGVLGIDYSRKEDFEFISCIRLPDFVTPDEFEWAREEAARKKKADFSAVELLPVHEGLCVQCMHVSPYDDEPATVAAMHAFLEVNGCVLDINDERRHHEIYLSDARRVAPERLKTVVRHPVKRV
ncbi:MAG: GyrI-like domain-containing protein [Eggerthellaceae bacterium]|nr:GyrI-like domain-containing protein [Eggerthellaceae bacterium]